MAKYEDFNVCVFSGRLFSDPDVRQTGNGTVVAEFSLAVNKRSKDEDEKPNSIRIVTFNKTAEFAEKYLKKGNKILVRTHVDTGEYTNKDGQKVYTTRFIADSIQFAQGKKDSADTQSSDMDADVAGFINVPEGITEELPFA